MSVHEQFAEDLALYALGTLQGEERVTLEKHLEDCPGCRLELEQLRGDMALIALSAAGATPPQRSRKRLLDAIAGDARLKPVPPRKASWWSPVPWLAAAALVVLVGWFWIQGDRLSQQVASLQNQVNDQQDQLLRAREVVATLTATDAMRVTLVEAKTPPQPQGRAIYVRDRSSLIFLANNMPALPPEKAYELWLIPMTGAPIPAGMFKPDAHGSAAVINPPLPANMEAKTFAITVEPQQGSLAPTSPVVMVGAGE
jgi:anti-sigma-K factor RskA